MLVFSDSQSLEIFCRKAFLCAFEGLQYNGKLESPFPMGALSGCSISCVPCAQFREKPRQPYLSLELGPTSQAPRGFREQERCQKWISGFFCLFPFQSLMGRGWRGLVPTHTNTNTYVRSWLQGIRSSKTQELYTVCQFKTRLWDYYSFQQSQTPESNLPALFHKFSKFYCSLHELCSTNMQEMKCYLF